ncbi:MAG TPA: 2-dehydropantoate 2-reductase [Rhodospirillaceae bacterium]|nr:2-dehydropantoate 2-reductase [Magnetovibrio sp.]HBT40577.1 2-dehydropantoate 2-reductase [Rhodospirillaceae bacterium]HCS68348.1 2-dehydropantoate 2-reductase [Rhodospirillaceae bacterium]|tara:strand:+ start:4758 stop:5675 length:918 start_codon:yes stop_codon:yes gene_type:complete
MRIAIMAAGGVGGYFGARLAAAGHDIHFLARGAHLKAIREGGLRVSSDKSDLHLKDVSVTDDPAEIGPVDAVLFAVKLWDTEASADQCKPLLGPDTLVVPFQNGVRSMDVLSERLGAAHVAGGVAHIAAVIGEPGLIKHTGTMARMTIGERDGTVTPRIEALKKAFEDGGFDHAVSPNITRSIWEKFIFLSCLSGLTSLCRQPAGPIRENPDARALFEAAIHETAAVGRAEGVPLPEGTEAKTIGFLDGLPAVMKASMFHDLEAGRRLELPWLSGEVVRLGRKHGIPTPVHAAVLGALTFYANGA